MSVALPRSPPIASASTLGRYEVLDRLARSGLEELVQAIAEVAGAERCVVGLVDPASGWLRTLIGAELSEAPQLMPFCAYVLFVDRALMIADARVVPALAHNPMVIADKVRFFAGVPLRKADGGKLGAVCLLSRSPRDLPEGTLRIVERLGRQVEAQVQLQRRVAELRDRHLEHLRTLQLLQGLLRAATTFAVMACDSSGQLMVFSEGAERLLGRRAREVVGHASLMSLLDADELATRSRQVSRELGREVTGFEAIVAGCRGGAAVEREWSLRRPSGAPFPASVVVAPMLGMREEITGYVAIARDITERKAVERMKDDFVSAVSHELRTPLTSIVGALGLTMGGAFGELPEPIAELTGIAHANSQRLLRLVNDILDVQKLGAGRFELERTPCDVAAIVGRAVQLMRPIAVEQGVAIEVIDSASGARAEVDFERMVQVFVNLLSNAIKFSARDGRVRVMIERRRDRVRISVVDEGPGIPEAFRSRVFDKFMQASVGDAVHRGGTGLGLSIVKSIVELHAGTVSFESETGKGTTFRVELAALEEAKAFRREPRRG